MNRLLRLIYSRFIDTIRQIIDEITIDISIVDITLTGDTLMCQTTDLINQLQISQDTNQYIWTSPNIALLMTAEAGEELNDIIPTIKIHGNIKKCCVYSDMFLQSNRIYLFEEKGNDIKPLKAFRVTFTNNTDSSGVFFTMKV